MIVVPSLKKLHFTIQLQVAVPFYQLQFQIISYPTEGLYQRPTCVFPHTTIENSIQRN